MIGLLSHVLGFGIPKGDGIIAVCLACCVVGGLYKLSQCKLRDCSCCRWAFRTFGVDKFDDFNVVVLVHEVKFSHSDAKLTTMVRVSAGTHEVVTQTSKKKLFQEPLLVTVEQGTTVLHVELLNKKKKVLAKVELDIAKDILSSKADIREHAFSMKPLAKELRNPSVTLTIDLHSKPWEMGGAAGAADEETGLLSKGLVWKIVQDMPQDVQTAIYTHLQKVQEQIRMEEDDEEEEGPELSDELARLQLLARACRGNISWVSSSGLSTGQKKDRYMAVQCPPDHKVYMLGLWKSEEALKKKEAPEKEIHLLRIRGVQSNRQKNNVVMISWQETPTQKEDAMFYSLDRGDAVWIELMTLLIKLAHEYKDKKKADKVLADKVAGAGAASVSTASISSKGLRR